MFLNGQQFTNNFESFILSFSELFSGHLQDTEIPSAGIMKRGGNLFRNPQSHSLDKLLILML